jgi:hypothetical protein
MLDSDFWKKLEKKFRSVQDCARVHFNWTDVGLPDLELWDCALRGTALLTARLRFEGLARRAGTRIDPQCLDSLSVWLSLLKRKGRQDLVRPGNEPGRGQIQCVCEVSADYCLVLENRAIEAERRARIEEERQPSPKNSTPLEQWVPDSTEKPLEVTKEGKNQATKRIPGTIESRIAGRRVARFISQTSGMTQTQFAIKSNTTDRTIRSFLKTGKVRKDIFRDIAKAMDILPEDLLKPDEPNGK